MKPKRLLDYQHFDGKAIVACSAGPDSMALLDFLCSKNKVESVLYVDHSYDSEFVEQSIDCISNYLASKHHRIRFIKHKIYAEKPKDVSLEQFWREQRISFYRMEARNSLTTNTIVTGHNLDDLVETWVMSSMNGGSKLMPRKSMFDDMILFKPLLHTRKSAMIEWCNKNNVPYVLDPSNYDECSKFDRVKVRNLLIPTALTIYPGLYNMVRRKSLENGD